MFIQKLKMRFEIFTLLIHEINCFYLNSTKSAFGLRDDSALEALIDHECRECAHDFNDGGVEKGRMVTVMPVIHPVYKISIEFYVWASNSEGSHWDNLFHFAKADDANTIDCIHRSAGMWLQQNEGDSRKITTNIQTCVNSAVKVFKPVVTKDQWHALEFGQYAQRMDNTDVTHHFYVELDGQIIHEEQNFDPVTFHDVKVFMSDPWSSAAYGLIRKFKYRKYDDFCLNYCP